VPGQSTEGIWVALRSKIQCGNSRVRLRYPWEILRCCERCGWLSGTYVSLFVAIWPVLTDVFFCPCSDPNVPPPSRYGVDVNKIPPSVHTVSRTGRRSTSPPRTLSGTQAPYVLYLRQYTDHLRPISQGRGRHSHQRRTQEKTCLGRHGFRVFTTTFMYASLLYSVVFCF
jgi:hypothetical protein